MELNEKELESNIELQESSQLLEIKKNNLENAVSVAEDILVNLVDGYGNLGFGCFSGVRWQRSIGYYYLLFAGHPQDV